ncbi:MAG: aldehyde dehydrogenase family protein [Phycisphaerales bacterium]
MKTYKLFIGGKFPRTESGRSTLVHDIGTGHTAHVCRASRKDLRNAVETAHGADRAWSGSSAYLRGQILYRLAEMMEGKRAELASAIEHDGEREVDTAIDRVVHFAGWTDKYSSVMGGSNPVSGPYHNFTIPGSMGVVGCIAPDSPPLLGLISMIAGPLAMGNTVVALASEHNPIPAMILAEALATSDVPAGVVNLLTGFREELVPHYSSHREIIAIHAGGVSDEQRTQLREGAAVNLKRVCLREDPIDYFDDSQCSGPAWLDPFVEFKTIWHPSAV